MMTKNFNFDVQLSPARRQNYSRGRAVDCYPTWHLHWHVSGGCGHVHSCGPADGQEDSDPFPADWRGHKPLCRCRCMSFLIPLMPLYLFCSLKLLVHVWGYYWNSRHISWRAETKTAGYVWCLSVDFNNMENAYRGWLHYEEGVFLDLIFVYFPWCLIQVTRVALERCVEKRAAYLARIGAYRPDQLVFADESALNRRTTYGGHVWAIKGQKATRKVFFIGERR